MGKKKTSTPILESQLLVPRHAGVSPESVSIFGYTQCLGLAGAQTRRDGLQRIVDTHCHLLSTFTAFRRKYKESSIDSIQAFAKHYLSEVHGVVDVWCDAPLEPSLNQVLAVPESEWPFPYRFICGLHPHDAKKFDDNTEAQLRKALAHPSNVGLGEIGLDYHYDHSPRDVQHTVLRKQLRMAIELSKPITIHTREADDDIYAILTDVVPREWNIHVHCFTDSPELGQKLLDYFPNLVFGLTGVLTYTSNTNTSNLLRHMITRPEKPRIVLETDSPFMTPINIPYKELGLKNARSMPVCHSGMITYTAAFAAEVLGQGWTADAVVRLSAEHSKNHYGV